MKAWFYDDVGNGRRHYFASKDIFLGQGPLIVSRVSSRPSFFLHCKMLFERALGLSESPLYQ